MARWISFIAFAAAVLAVNGERLPCFSGKVDIVLVIDVSGSSEAKFMANRDSALEVSRSLPIGWDKVAIAIIQYSKLAIMKLEFQSSTTWETVNDTISNLEWTGDVQKTAEAMDLAMIMFRRSRPDAQRVIILFSDGNSFNSWQEVVDTSERLRYSQAKIFAVSLGGSTYETELKRYIEFSNGSIIRRESDFQELKRELQSMTVPRCPPPAAAPPQDFLRPAESGQEGDSENQLPTRPSDSQFPTRPNNQPKRTTRRNLITRTTRTTTTTTTTVAPGGPPPPGAAVIDTTITKQRK